jgi:hypothetical protein
MTRRPVPYVCPTCRAEPGGYYGRLVFPEELPVEAPVTGVFPPAVVPVPCCPYHPKVALVPVFTH